MPEGDRRQSEAPATQGDSSAGRLSVAIAGASGYAGGEFLRLALGHPRLQVSHVTSERRAGEPVTTVHPNLRSVTSLRFSKLSELPAVDVMVSALPHGELAGQVDELLDRAGTLIDLSADFRLSSPELYRRYYETDHPRPELLGQFVYALPELRRNELRAARLIAGAGCIATASALALAPLASAELLARRDVVVDAKIGSSAAGSEVKLASHHPERAGAVRTYAATGHRHQAELAELFPALDVHITATAIERVRGVLVTAHLFTRPGTSHAEVADAFRRAYRDEPFVRLIHPGRGIHRVPDPRILDGSNWCDIGFELDDASGRLVVMSAIDNLVKGTAGHAMQALNLSRGWPEASGLGFPGLHP